MAKDKIRWGVLGCARIALNSFLPALTRSETGSLAAIASRDRSKAEAEGEKFGAERFYGSYEELLDSGVIDALYIPLPNNMHKEYTLKAVQRGIHVLCEKPFAMNQKEALEMKEACRKNSVKLMSGFMWQLDPMNQRALQIVRLGEIGKIKYMNATFTSNLPRHDDFRLQRKMGGGSLMDAGVYCVNTFRRFMGKEPVEVVGLSVTPTLKADVDETFCGILHFDEGEIAAFVSSFGMSRQNRYEIVAEKGMICSPTGPWRRSEPNKIDVITDDTVREESFEESDPFKNEIDYFTGCIQSDKEPDPGGEDGYLEMKVLDALVESALSGKKVEIK